MSPEECLMLGRAVAAICPAQKFDQHTPAAWLELLGDLRFDDARAAVFALGKSQPFIAPCDIRAEVKRIRAKRLHENELPEPPAGQTVPEYLEWRRETTAAIADGRLVTGPAAIVSGEWPSLAQLTSAMPPEAREIVRQATSADDEQAAS